MGVKLHRVADDVGHLVKAPVVHFTQAVQDAALDGLQSVVLVWDGTLKDDVARVIEEVVVVHPPNGNDVLHLPRFRGRFVAREFVVALVALVVVNVFVLTHASVTSSFSTRRFSMMNC